MKYQDEKNRRIHDSSDSFTPLTPYDSADETRNLNLMDKSFFEKVSLQKLQSIFEYEREFIREHGSYEKSQISILYPYSQDIRSENTFSATVEEPMINEELILTQAQDRDAHDILLWMLDDSDEH